MAGITSGGIGSGLDINSLVSQLVAAERAPAARRLDQQELEARTRLSAFGTLKSGLDGLRSAMAKLGEASTFQARQASTSDDTVLTASAADDAAPGRFEVEVVQIAESHKLISGGLADADTLVGTGTLSIASGSQTFDVVVDASNNTLAGIRDAINAASGNESVVASIINVDDGLGGTHSKLVLTAAQTGTQNAISVTAADDDLNDTDAAGLSRLVYDPSGSGTTNLAQVRAAADAQILVDQQSVTRSSNSIDGVIEGVTLNLLAAAPGQSIEIGVNYENGSASSTISSFVKSLNSVLDSLKSLGSYDAESQSAGPLLTDSSVRTLEFLLRKELGDVVPGLAGGLSSLTQIGITTNEAGRLEIDGASLDAALATDQNAVGELFTSSEGYAARLDDLLGRYLDPGGIIAIRTEGLDQRVDRVQERRAALDLRLESVEKRLLRQFTAMDALVGRLQATSDFLTRQLGQLETLRLGNK